MAIRWTISLLATALLLQAAEPAAKSATIVAEGKPLNGLMPGWTQKDGYIEGKGMTALSIVNSGLGRGDFHISARLRMIEQKFRDRMKQVTFPWLEGAGSGESFDVDHEFTEP